MENFSVPVEIFSADGTRSVTIDALVDTRVCFPCLPSSLLRELGIVPDRTIQSQFPDGRIVDDEVGEVRVRLQGVDTMTVAIFGAESDPAILGHLVLTGAMLAVDPDGKRLVPARISHVSHPVLMTGANISQP